jgi:hypothetical protein
LIVDKVVYTLKTDIMKFGLEGNLLAELIINKKLMRKINA